MRRLVHKFRYPTTNRGYFWILGLALLVFVPRANWISWALILALCLAVMRSSMRGQDEMPAPADFRPAGSFGRLWLKGIAVTLAVLWPYTLLVLIAWIPEINFLGSFLIPLYIATFFFLYFLPAALASLVRGEGLGEALTPALLKRSIRAAGEAYRVPALLFSFLSFFVGILLLILEQSVPHVGPLLAQIIRIWCLLVMARSFGLVFLIPRSERVALRTEGDEPLRVS